MTRTIGPGGSHPVDGLSPPAWDGSTTGTEKRSDGRGFGVAITAKGQFLFYGLHAYNDFQPEYRLYRSLGEAFRDWNEVFDSYEWPRDIVQAAATQLGHDLVIELDI